MSHLCFQNRQFEGCDDTGAAQTCFSNGNQVLNVYHFNGDGSLSLHYLLLGICTLCYPIAAMLAHRLMAFIRSH